MIVTYSLTLQTTISCKDSLNVAKVQYKLRVAFSLNLVWYGSMDWIMEKIFCMK